LKCRYKAPNYADRDRIFNPVDPGFQHAAALAFYRDLLGFEVVTDSGNGDDSSWVFGSSLRAVSLMLNDPV
jgi:hypothetical protein